MFAKTIRSVKCFKGSYKCCIPSQFYSCYRPDLKQLKRLRRVNRLICDYNDDCLAENSRLGKAKWINGEKELRFNARITHLPKVVPYLKFFTKYLDTSTWCPCNFWQNLQQRTCLKESTWFGSFSIKEVSSGSILTKEPDLFLGMRSFLGTISKLQTYCKWFYTQIDE